MADISHLGTVVTLSASKTTGGSPISLTAFPDDADPFDIPEVDVAEYEIGTNGDVATWSVNKRIEVTLSILPCTEDNEVMLSLVATNRPQKGKPITKDVITLTRVSPNGEVIVLGKGRLLSASVSSSMQSSGRYKTPTYKFAFATLTRTPVLDVDQSF